jgi:hypothetical protein
MRLIADIRRLRLTTEATSAPRGEALAGRRVANPVERLAGCIAVIALVPVPPDRQTKDAPGPWRTVVSLGPSG